jgi:hypothetical protein
VRAPRAPIRAPRRRRRAAAPRLRRAAPRRGGPEKLQTHSYDDATGRVPACRTAAAAAPLRIRARRCGAWLPR